MMLDLSSGGGKRGSFSFSAVVVGLVVVAVSPSSFLVEEASVCDKRKVRTRGKEGRTEGNKNEKRTEVEVSVEVEVEVEEEEEEVVEAFSSTL
jgi:hypothetical protein